MSIGCDIRIALRTLMINHTAYREVMETLHRRVQDTFDNVAPCCELLVAPSRCGKTKLMEVIYAQFPQVNELGRRKIPLLCVTVPPSTGSKELIHAVIKALGLPIPKSFKTAGELTTFMFNQLALAKVRVIFFDEASHIVEPGAKIPARAASDWFKAFQVAPHEIGIVLAGVPRLTRLLDYNEQLRNRVHKPLTLMPYRYDDRKQRAAFAGCVNKFLAEFEVRGCSLGMPLDEFVRNAYAASAGYIGLLSNLFVEIATLITAPCVITEQLCAKATQALNLPGDGTVTPFSSTKLSDIDLMHVLAAELGRCDLVLRPLSVVSELAQARVDEIRMVSL